MDDFQEIRRCPYCGERLPPPKLDFEREQKRKIRIPLTLEILSVLGITLISLSVAISVFITYRITNTINGNVTSKIGELYQNIETLTTTVNGDILSQIGELQQSINIASFGIETSNPQASMNVRFSCVDSETSTVLSDCLLHVRILEEAQVSEYDIGTDNQTQITIHLQRRLEITATRDGFKTATEIFEYIEDGSVVSHVVRLDKATP